MGLIASHRVSKVQDWWLVNDPNVLSVIGLQIKMVEATFVFLIQLLPQPQEPTPRSPTPTFFIQIRFYIL